MIGPAGPLLGWVVAASPSGAAWRSARLPVRLRRGRGLGLGVGVPVGDGEGVVAVGEGVAVGARPGDAVAGGSAVTLSVRERQPVVLPVSASAGTDENQKELASD